MSNRRIKDMACVRRWGSRLRVWDNGGTQAPGGTIDRYTIMPPRWAHEYRQRDHTRFLCLGADDQPYAPQGFGMTVTGVPGPHLGKRIAWHELPPDVAQAARELFPEYA